MKNLVFLSCVFLLSTSSFAGRIYRADPEIDDPLSEFRKVRSHPKFSLKGKNLGIEREPARKNQLKHKRRLARLKRMRSNVSFDENRMDVDYQSIDQVQLCSSVSFNENRMDVDYQSLGEVQCDLNAMDWMLTGCHTTGNVVMDVDSDPFQEMRAHSNQMDWMPTFPLMDINPKNLSCSQSVASDIEMETHAFSGGVNFYDWVVGNEGDVIKLYGYGHDLSVMINEGGERINYLNCALNNHTIEQYYDSYTAHMICAGIHDELNQVTENYQEMSYYLSSLEAKINWIMSDPSQEYQQYALQMHISTLEEQHQKKFAPVLYAPEIHAFEFQDQNTHDEVGSSTIIDRSIDQSDTLHESVTSFPYYENPEPVRHWTFHLQDITPTRQNMPIHEDPRINKENVMGADRQRAAQGSIPSVIRHTNGWMRSDVDAHEDELFNEVLAYLGSMKPQKNKFKRTGSNSDEVSNAIYALVGQTSGNDFPNFLSPAEVTMRGGGDAITVKKLLARVWVCIKNHKDKAESENMRYSLIRALGECIEKDGHRVCAVGKTQRILSVLQGYVEGVDMDSLKTRTDVISPSVTVSGASNSTTVKEEKKPDFNAFFQQFMITKMAIMQAIAEEPEEKHQGRLQSMLQKAVDEVVEVYGDDATKIRKTKEDFKSFIDLTFDVQIDYEEIEPSPLSLKGRSGADSERESGWKRPVVQAKSALKKMVGRVRDFCVKHATKMTSATAETVSFSIQFLRGYAEWVFGSTE